MTFERLKFRTLFVTSLTMFVQNHVNRSNSQEISIFLEYLLQVLGIIVVVGVISYSSAIEVALNELIPLRCEIGIRVVTERICKRLDGPLDPIHRLRCVRVLRCQCCFFFIFWNVEMVNLQASSLLLDLAE